MRTTNLEGRQRNWWQRRCIVVEIVGSADSTLKLNMHVEVLRCELYVAVADIIYDGFGMIYDALGRIGVRMADSSHC